MKRVDKFIVDWVAPIAFSLWIADAFHGWAFYLTVFLTQGVYWFARGFIGAMLSDRRPMVLSVRTSKQRGTFRAEATYKGETVEFDSEESFHAWLRSVGLRDK